MTKRLSLVMGAWLLLVTAGVAQVSTTTVSDTVYRADGSPALGSLLVSWPQFTTAAGDNVAAGSTTVTLSAGGALSVALAPNAGGDPIGSYYTVVYHLDDGSTARENWMVPVSGAPVNLAAVRSTVMPLSVAMQTVSKHYVDTAIARSAATVSAGIPAAATASTLGTVKLASGQTVSTLSKVATTGAYGDLSGTSDVATLSGAQAFSGAKSFTAATNFGSSGQTTVDGSGNIAAPDIQSTDAFSMSGQNILALPGSVNISSQVFGGRFESLGPNATTLPTQFLFSLMTGNRSSGVDVMKLQAANVWFPGTIEPYQHTPSGSTDTCTAGTMWTDASYIYVCAATNAIKRAALSSF